MEFNFLHDLFGVLLDEWARLLLLFGAGIGAGFLSTVAFGGSLLALPVLIFLGLDGSVANGTNRVAIFCQNVSAILGFRRKGVSDFGFSIQLAIPAVIGAVIGTLIAVDIKDTIFNLILAVVMVVMLVLTLINPTKRLEDRMGNEGNRSKVIAMVVFFFIGIYGGFIQAGVGLLVITALRLLTGIDLVRTNAIKVLVIFFYTVVALGIFIVNDKVNWYLGLTLAAGNACGAWLGSHWAVEKGDKWIKVVLIVAVVAFAIRLIWLSVGGS